MNAADMKERRDARLGISNSCVLLALGGVLLAACGATERDLDPEPEQSQAPALQACTEPTQTAVPFSRAVPDDSTQPILRWARGPGCLDVSHEPAVSAVLSTWLFAIEAYNDIDCSRLCLSRPEERTLGTDEFPRHNIHLEIGELSPGGHAQPTTYFQESTGEIFHVRIGVDPSHPSATDETAALHALGHALGLAHTHDVESVMQATGPLPPLPTEHDAAAICAMYGAAPDLCPSD